LYFKYINYGNNNLICDQRFNKPHRME